MTLDELPPDDLWVNARDLWKLLQHRPSVPCGAPDIFGMYPPNLICLREILRGSASGCEYGTVSIIRVRRECRHEVVEWRYG